MEEQQQPIQVVKDGGRWRNAGSVILLLMCAVGCLSLVVVSFSQVTENTTTASKVALFTVSDPCNNSPLLVEHRPLRFFFSNDVSNRIYKCPWPYKNSALRLGLTLVTILVTILAIRGMLRRRRLLVWICLVAMAVLGAVFFYAMAVDANAVRLSYEWCHAGMNGGMPWNNNAGVSSSKVVCAYTPYAIAALLDAVHFVLLWVTVIFIFITMRRWGKYEEYRVQNNGEATSLLGSDAPTPYTQPAPKDSRSARNSVNLAPAPAMLAQPFAPSSAHVAPAVADDASAPSLQEEAALAAAKWAVENPETAKRVIRKAGQAGDPYIKQTLSSVFGTNGNQ